jgi:hypothetical protein
MFPRGDQLDVNDEEACLIDSIDNATSITPNISPRVMLLVPLGWGVFAILLDIDRVVLSSEY